jgi:maltooligosyltrehalose trehalohydrolase
MNEAAAEVRRRMPIGAEPVPGGGIHFRVWAPRARAMIAVIEREDRNTSVALTSEAGGYFAGYSAEAKPGDLYRFSIKGESSLMPDPASRFQPEGPLGPSMIVEPRAYRWRDADWPGLRARGRVLYEMHIGTFTPEGTWKAASRELAELKALGITTLEIMPVHDFCGRYGWGYDSVDFFAPTRLYGRPDDLRAFVDQAHAIGLEVILDVVYNHAGPAGNFLKNFSESYFTDRYATEWGEPFNFDSAPVREFFVANAGYWIDEFHFDGLRLDATQNIYDSPDDHILAEITRRVREAGGRRATFVVAENEPQHSRLIRPVEQGGYGMDAAWNDDFHHSAIAALTGHNEAYFSDHLGKPQEFISAAKRGYLYQGQYYMWQKQRRGTSTAGLPAAAFVHYLQNHDQIANLGRGWRIHRRSHPGMYRAMTALLLLMPQTPLLFQGQEFAATAPFVFFADHEPELAAKVKEGRFKFLSQFPGNGSPEMRPYLPDPTDPAVFEACRLDLTERQRHGEAYALHRDLLRLRREDPVFSARSALDGAVLSEAAFVLRFFSPDGDDRLLLVNLGLDVRLMPLPEPLLAPPAGNQWRLLWSSENPRYGGDGAASVEGPESWFIPGKAAFVFSPESDT